MTMYVYGTGGEPRGFLFETTIYGLDGEPLGRLLGCRVHRFDGSYVGQWFHQMVVERPEAQARQVGAAPVPQPRPPVSAVGPRRHVAEYGSFADAFDRLVVPGAETPIQEAAE